MNHRLVTFLALGLLALPLASCEQPVASLGVNLGDLFPAADGRYWRYNNQGRSDVSYWIRDGEVDVDGESLPAFRIWVAPEQQIIDDYGDDQDEWAVLLFFRRTATGWYIAGWEANPDGPSAGLGDEFFEGDGIPFATSNVSIGQTITTEAAGAEWTTTYIDEEDGPFEFNGQSYTEVWHINIASSIGNFPFEGDYWLKSGPGIISYDVVGYRPESGEAWNHIHNDVLANIFGTD